MRVVVLVKATADSEAGTIPSTELLDAMGKFNEELVNAGIMQAGEGLHPSSKGKRVAFDGASRKVIDGPFANTRELVAGFWIWKVKDMAEAKLEVMDVETLRLHYAKTLSHWSRRLEANLEAARAYWGLKLAREMRYMLEDGLDQLGNARARLAERIAEGDAEVTIQDQQRIDTILAEGSLTSRVPEMQTRARLYELIDYEGYTAFDDGIYTFDLGTNRNG